MKKPWLRVQLTALVLLALISCSGPKSGESVQRADIVFHSGVIHTVTGGNVEAVAVTGDTVTFVGSKTDVNELIGPDTRVIDLAGNTLIPGLIDSHNHIFNGSFSAQRVNLSLADTPDKLADALLELRLDNPGDGAIYARGWQNHLFPPDGPRKETLDEVFGDRAVVLGSVDGHSTWYSSKAFEMAGVDANTPDPEPGVRFYERDELSGELLGTTREGGGSAVTEAVIDLDRDAYKKALEQWLPRAAAAGITGVYDAGASAPTEEDAYEILGELEREGKLTLRVFGSTRSDAGSGDPAERLLDFRDRFTGQYHRPYAVKIVVDGVPEAHTAYLLTPYVDRPGSTGEPMLSDEELVAMMSSAFEKDVPVHIHAIGDAAIRMSLDAIETAQKATGKFDAAVAIAHMDFVSEQDIPRFAELGVVAQTSIQWAAQDPSYQNIGSFVGIDRMDAAYPVKSLLASGAVQTFGADWPAAAYFSTYRPLDMLEVAVTRQLPGQIEMPIRNADERIDLQQAIASMTIRSAMQLGMESELGSIEPGKKADLVVLEQNLFDIPEHEIHNAQVLMTIMDGRIVHE